MKSFEQFSEEMHLELEEYSSEKMANRERASRDYRKKVGLDKKVILPKSLPVAEEVEGLEESSMNRIADKAKKGGLGHISAERGDKSKKENNKRSAQLAKDIRGKGLPGPTKVTGNYTENDGTAEGRKVKEKSYAVSSGKMGKRKFKKAMTSLGKKYNQDSVLVQQKPGGQAKLKATNEGGKKDMKGWDGKVGKMKPGKSGDMQTTVKNKSYTHE